MAAESVSEAREAGGVERGEYPYSTHTYTHRVTVELSGLHVC